jgi:formate hydrogenlyase subunit 4
MNPYGCLHVLLALALAPLLGGVINRIKAWVAGRRGQPLLQGYYDLARLLRKGAVYSATTTWVFRLGPPAGLAAVAAALLLTPLGGVSAAVAFPGDFLLAAYMLGVARFATMLAALDTGSSFEGMGASREAQFAALAEPALLLGLLGLARATGSVRLSAMLAAAGPALWSVAGAALALILVAWVLVFLVENARIPFDDPNTHLELTMIHEVMVLDHGGPDFACIQYAASLKMWVLGAWLTGLAMPLRTGAPLLDLAAGLAALFVLAVGVGAVESGLARVRLLRVPPLLIAAGAMSVVALILLLRGAA